MHDRESIRREITALSLPSIVSQIFDGTASRPELSHRCEFPYNSLVTGSGLPEGLLPLWECGTTITAYDRTNQTFCKIDLETPESLSFRVKNFDGVAADLLIDLWEDEIPDFTLAELADDLGFFRLDQLVIALEAGPGGNYAEWRESLRTDSEQGIPPNDR